MPSPIKGLSLLRKVQRLEAKVPDRGWLATSSSPVPLRIRRVRERFTRAQKFSLGGLWYLGEGVPDQVSSSSLDYDEVRHQNPPCS
ncbi:hypothetical protein TNCV_3237271 [Trichonephila clavipes]|nr:hypothetical protein TNCV_3237271 [Trichonephila clavipes]